MKSREELRDIYLKETLQYPKDEYPEMYAEEEEKKAELYRYAVIAGEVASGIQQLPDVQAWFKNYIACQVYEKLCNENGIFVPPDEMIGLYNTMGLGGKDDE